MISIIGGSIAAATTAIVAPVVVLTANSRKKMDENATILKTRNELKKAKDNAKALIDNISISIVNGHDARLFTKIEEGKAATKNAIDAAANINEIKSLVSYKDGSSMALNSKKFKN